jgi:broad specificity phosphatase PhoE
MKDSPEVFMRTTIYLIRHAATEANLAQPPRLQGRKDSPLAKFGILQAQATRDFLAMRTIDKCYCSPLIRAVETASIICEPHRIEPIPMEGLTECDVGAWEGMDWQSIRYFDAENYHKFMSNPALNGYPNGESFSQVHSRAVASIEEIFANQEGMSILVVSHHIVNRTYLAGVLGMGIDQARSVSLENCGISVVVREDQKTTVTTLNASFHLQGVAA